MLHKHVPMRNRLCDWSTIPLELCLSKIFQDVSPGSRAIARHRLELLHGHHEFRLNCCGYSKGGKYRMHRRYKLKTVATGGRRKRFSPLMLIGLSVPVVLAIIASAVF